MLLLLAGCRIDIELVGPPWVADSGEIPAGPVTVPLGIAPPPGSCTSGFLRVGQRLDSHVSHSSSPAKLQEWQLTGGVLADWLGRPNTDRDLLFALTCGSRCGAAGQIVVSTGEDPFLKDIETVGLQLGTPGTGVSFVTCDLDGDGVDEVAVTDVSGAGDLMDVFWEGDIGSRATLVQTLEPDKDFGLDLACGDFVGDERNDLLVASTERFRFYTAGEGVRELVSSRGPWLFDAPTALSGVGDADGDGAPDLAYATVGGGLLRRYGAHGLPLAPFVGEISPEIAGDVNGDGLDDLLVANRVGGSASVSLLLGAVDDAWSEAARTLEIGRTALVPRVVGLSDLDGDGYREVAVSTVTNDDLAGRFDVYPGTVSGIGVDPLYSCAGVEGEELGVGMANVGDLDGDGRDELIVTRRVANATTVFEVMTRSGVQDR